MTDERREANTRDGLEVLREIIDEPETDQNLALLERLDYPYGEWVAERARHQAERERLERYRDLVTATRRGGAGWTWRRSLGDSSTSGRVGRGADAEAAPSRGPRRP